MTNFICTFNPIDAALKDGAVTVAIHDFRQLKKSKLDSSRRDAGRNLSRKYRKI